MTKEEVEKEFNEIEINPLWIWVVLPLFSLVVWFLLSAEIHWVVVLFDLNSIESSIRYLISAILILYVLCTIFIVKCGGEIESDRYEQWEQRVRKDFIGQLETKRFEVEEVTVLAEPLETFDFSNKEVEVRIKEVRDGIFFERTLITKIVKESLLESPYLTYQEFEGFDEEGISSQFRPGKYNMTLFIPE